VGESEITMGDRTGLEVRLQEDMNVSTSPSPNRGRVSSGHLNTGWVVIGIEVIGLIRRNSITHLFMKVYRRWVFKG